MGELFANLKGIDVQAMRREAREAAEKEVREEVKEEVRAEVKEEVREEVKEEVRAEVKAEDRQDAINNLIWTLKELKISDEIIKEQVRKRYQLDSKETDKVVADLMHT